MLMFMCLTLTHTESKDVHTKPSWRSRKNFLKIVDGNGFSLERLTIEAEYCTNEAQ